MGHQPRSSPARAAASLVALVSLAALVAAAPLPAGAGTADADRERGRALLREGRHAEAIEAFRAAIRAGGDDPGVWFDLARASSAAGDAAGAIEAYSRVLELEPGNARAAHNLGNVHFRAGRHAEAERLYGRALELDPDYLLALFHHGYVLHQLNRPDEAAARFDRCLAHRPADAREARTRFDCGFYRGVLRFRAGELDAAAAIMEEVVRALPQHPEAHHYLGMAYRRLGRLEEARRELELHARLKAAQRSDAPIRKDPGAVGDDDGVGDR